MKTGKIDILCAGIGDVKVTFTDDGKAIFTIGDNTEEKDIEGVLALLQQMQRNGGSILVANENGEMVRATTIDRETKEYIIQGDNGEVRAAIDEAEATVTGQMAGG